MKWPFRSKKKIVPEKEDVRKVGSRMICITSLDMFGPFSESENGQYLLVRQDSDRERGIGGYCHSGNGTFAITDTLFGDKLGLEFYVYSALNRTPISEISGHFLLIFRF